MKQKYKEGTKEEFQGEHEYREESRREKKKLRGEALSGKEL